jgi:tetratricopeptide (TPR) repeat protein
LDDALRLAESLDDQRKIAEVCHGAGIVAWHCGLNAEAMRHYQRAFELCKSLGDSPGTGLALNSLGVTLVSLGQTAEAQQRLEEAKDFNRKAGERLLEGHALSALGDLHHDLGRLAEAKRCYLRSLRLRYLVQDRRGQGWMLERLARISRASGDFSAEARQLEAARRIAEEIDEKELLRSCQLEPTGR